MSNLLVWTACFGRNQQLHQHHHGAGRALSHRQETFTSLCRTDTVASGVTLGSSTPSSTCGVLVIPRGISAIPGHPVYKYTQTQGLLLQLLGHVCKFCSSAHAGLELLGHEWGGPDQTSLFLGAHWEYPSHFLRVCPP